MRVGQETRLLSPENREKTGKVGYNLCRKRQVTIPITIPIPIPSWKVNHDGQDEPSQPSVSSLSRYP